MAASDSIERPRAALPPSPLRSNDRCPRRSTRYICLRRTRRSPRSPPNCEVSLQNCQEDRGREREGGGASSLLSCEVRPKGARGWEERGNSAATAAPPVPHRIRRAKMNGRQRKLDLLSCIAFPDPFIPFARVSRCLTMLTQMCKCALNGVFSITEAYFAAFITSID